MGAAVFPPVRDHAELRQSEGEKGTDGIERDQFVGDSTEKNEQDARQDGKDDNAVAEDQAASAIAKGVRQIVVLGNGAAEAREIGKRSVRGKRENEENRSDGEVIKNDFTEKRGDAHGEKAPVTGLC